MANTESFWTTFLQLKDAFSDEASNQEAMTDLLEALCKIDDRLYFHVGHKDDSIDLILSAEGNPDLGSATE